MNIDQECWQLDAYLTEMLFESNLSVREMAKRLDMSEAKVNQRIRQLGLGWVKRDNRKLSRGHAALVALLNKLLPNIEVCNEYYLGERLTLDIYCPKYNLGIEFHGRQHFTFISMFHGDEMGFEDS